MVERRPAAGVLAHPPAERVARTERIRLGLVQRRRRAVDDGELESAPQGLRAGPGCQCARRGAIALPVRRVREGGERVAGALQVADQRALIEHDERTRGA